MHTIANVFFTENQSCNQLIQLKIGTFPKESNYCTNIFDTFTSFFVKYEDITRLTGNDPYLHLNDPKMRIHDLECTWKI